MVIHAVCLELGLQGLRLLELIEATTYQHKAAFYTPYFAWDGGIKGCFPQGEPLIDHLLPVI